MTNGSSAPLAPTPLIWWKDRTTGIYYSQCERWAIWVDYRRGGTNRLGKRWVLSFVEKKDDSDPSDRDELHVFFRLRDAKAFGEAHRQDPDGWQQGFDVVEGESDAACSDNCGRVGTHFCPKNPRRLGFVESLALAMNSEVTDP